MSLGLYLSCALGALVWQFCFGLRAILLHQVIDFASDGLSGTRTFARQSGISQLRRWAARVLVPAELAGLLVLLLVVHDGSGAVLWFVVAYLSLAVLWQTAIKKEAYQFLPAKPGARVPLFELYEFFLPLMGAVVVALVSPPHSFVVLLFHVFLFQKRFRKGARLVRAGRGLWRGA